MEEGGGCVPIALGSTARGHSEYLVSSATGCGGARPDLSPWPGLGSDVGRSRHRVTLGPKSGFHPNRDNKGMQYGPCCINGAQFDPTAERPQWVTPTNGWSGRMRQRVVALPNGWTRRMSGYLSGCDPL